MIVFLRLRGANAARVDAKNGGFVQRCRQFKESTTASRPTAETPKPIINSVKVSCDR
jgi:hypothetical protein